MTKDLKVIPFCICIRMHIATNPMAIIDIAVIPTGKTLYMMKTVKNIKYIELLVVLESTIKK